MTVISFNKKGYDGFIDFIKAYAIIAVLIGHTVPNLDMVAYFVWLGMQVPLFLLVQAFHVFKKDTPKVLLSKIFQRVLVPFFAIEIITVILALIFTTNTSKLLIVSVLTGGGYGPGSYYPWLYLQFALLLPLFAKLLSRYSKVVTLVLFLLLCEGFEILLSFVNIPEFIYRLLAIRYLFLIWLGWQWTKDGIMINWLTIILSLLSLAAIIYFEYFSIDDEPWFYNTDWKCHRWPCYFFVAYGFTAILHLLWRGISQMIIVSNGVKQLASASYEIFLIQMSTIFLFKVENLAFIQSETVQLLIWIFIVWFVSIAGGILLHKLINKW